MTSIVRDLFFAAPAGILLAASARYGNWHTALVMGLPLWSTYLLGRMHGGESMARFHAKLYRVEDEPPPEDSDAE